MTLRFTTYLVQIWVRLYTIGLPAEVKMIRRGEIYSDLWEQRQDAGQPHQGQRGVMWHMLGRMVFGMLNDLFWRSERSLGKERGDYMNLATHLIRPRTYINLAVVLVSMFVLFPIVLAHSLRRW